MTGISVQVFSTDVGTGSDGKSLSGTSMATPMIAGISALVRQKHPDWTPGETKEQLRKRAATVADMGGKTFTQDFGDGLLDIAALLASD